MEGKKKSLTEVRASFQSNVGPTLSAQSSPGPELFPQDPPTPICALQKGAVGTSPSRRGGHSSSYFMDFHHKEIPIIHNQARLNPSQVQGAVSRAVWVGTELSHSRSGTYLLSNYGSGTVPGAGHASCLLGAHKTCTQTTKPLPHTVWLLDPQRHPPGAH